MSLATKDPNPDHFTGSPGSLGNLDRLVENQGDSALRHGRVEFLRNGADKDFLVHLPTVV